MTQMFIVILEGNYKHGLQGLEDGRNKCVKIDHIGLNVFNIIRFLISQNRRQLIRIVFLCVTLCSDVFFM